MRERILMLDADKEGCERIVAELAKDSFKCDAATSIGAAQQLMQSQDYAVVFVEVELEGESGLAFCRWANDNRPQVPVVLMGQPEKADGVSALRAGAYDLITKPYETSQVKSVLHRALRHYQLHHRLSRICQGEPERTTGELLLGQSAPMQKLTEMIDRVASSDATVLISGESGTGKELVARSLHQKSSRAEGPFVGVNCAALPRELLESELFGHERGAFTDAKRSREGLFREAAGGTLFLDEIGETSPAMQVKLLRALQERVVRPVGGMYDVPFDTRIIAATNQDLEVSVQQGTFREDLYYRINVVHLKTPSLRSRGHDVLVLAQHFLEAIAQRSGKGVRAISASAARVLLDYDWPGNVRQLENTIERAMAMAQFDEIVVEDLPEAIRTHTSTRLETADERPDELFTLNELERRYIERVLAAVAGNKTQAAKVLGLDRRTLHRKLARYQSSARRAQQLRKAASAPPASGARWNGSEGIGDVAATG